MAAVALSGCVVPPTPYQPRNQAFGYQSTKIEEALIRVEFHGNTRTSTRAVQAYALYRAAEVAKEANAPAFSLLEGTFDRKILEDTDTFSRRTGADLEPDDFVVSRLEHGNGAADTVVGQAPTPTVRTRGLSMRPPRPMQRAPALYRPPIYIYTPATPMALPQRSLLVRLLPTIPAEPDDRVFVTQQVLDQLGPRIIRPAVK